PFGLVEELAQNAQAWLGIFDDVLAEIDIDQLHANLIQHLLELDLAGGFLGADGEDQYVRIKVDHGLGLERPIGKIAENGKGGGGRTGSGVVAIAGQISGVEVVAPVHNTLERVVGFDGRQRTDKPAFAQNDPLDRTVKGDVPPGDVGHGEGFGKLTAGKKRTT